jgi:hypothetical protein
MEDISRYGYRKGKNIYNDLKGSELENHWLLERSLGYLLTGTIYPYVRNISSKKKLEKLRKIIKDLCEIPCVNMRKRIAEILFIYMKKKGFSENSLKTVESVMENMGFKIKKYFLDLCNLKWFYLATEFQESQKKKEDLNVILNYYRQELNGLYEWSPFGEIEKDYYEYHKLTKLVELAKEENNTLFLDRLFALSDNDKEMLPWAGERKLQTEEEINTLREEANVKLRDIDKPEIIKVSESLKVKPKVYAQLHQYVVGYSLKNIKKDGLNIFSPPKV